MAGVMNRPPSELEGRAALLTQHLEAAADQAATMIREGYTWDEIAYSLGVPSGAVRSVLGKDELLSRRDRAISKRALERRLDAVLKTFETTAPETRQTKEWQRWLLHEIAGIIFQWEAGGDGERDLTANEVAAGIIRLLE
jgi:predicted transcriptional regulator